MENTIENARKFVDVAQPIYWSIGSINPLDPDNLDLFKSVIPKMLVAYASQLSPVPDRIKIVVPSELGGMTNYRDGWNACLKSIRTLNPGAEVVEVDKNETK